MIIFGTYVIHRTLGSGQFHCPQCMGVSSYRLRRGRWFFHLLFIPLIPMKRTQPFVECDRCHAKFALGVLQPAELERQREALGDQFPAFGGGQMTAASLAAVPTLAPAPAPAPIPYAHIGGEALAYVRGLAAGVLARAETQTDAGLAAGVGLTRRIGVHDFSADHLRIDVAQLDTSYLPDLIRARVAAGWFQQPQARGLVMDALAVARANGDLTAAQWDWIVARALDAGLGPTATTEIRDGAPILS